MSAMRILWQLILVILALSIIGNGWWIILQLIFEGTVSEMPPNFWER